MKERIKFWIAYKLNKFDKTCWANLVMWALDYDYTLLPNTTNYKTTVWRQDCDVENEDIYCGKCQEVYDEY